MKIPDNNDILNFCLRYGFVAVIVLIVWFWLISPFVFHTINMFRPTCGRLDTGVSINIGDETYKITNLNVYSSLGRGSAEFSK